VFLLEVTTKRLKNIAELIDAKELQSEVGERMVTAVIATTVEVRPPILQLWTSCAAPFT
jgi:hypothetical protein